MDDIRNYEAYCQGNDEGLARIIKDHMNGLILFLCTFTGNYHDAEEIAEETFVRIAVRKPRYNGKASFKTWLYTIAKNAAKDHLRKDRTDTVPIESASGISSEEASLEEAYIREESRIAVHRAMSALPKDYQRVLWLVYFEGCSVKDAAKIMGRTQRAAHTLIYRARQRLKEELEQKGFRYEDL